MRKAAYPGSSQPVACPDCGYPMARKPRNFFQKLLYRAWFSCPACGTRVIWYAPRREAVVNLCRFMFSRHSICPACGGDRPKRLERRDLIDPVSKNPLARIQVLLGAPILRCSPCRLQYYDWRTLKKQ